MANNFFSNKDNLAPLVTKGSHKIKNQSGQITIFFAVAVVVIVTLISFVVNIGLFVKAKINLQNATDAAAWSGAATQARQLTDIAYMNWEMRNVYKQWMFKYYVLGNLSAKGVRTPGEQGNARNVTGDRNVMDFTIGPANSEDRFNIPSVCIHPRSQLTGNNIQGDICSVYSIPGLPRLTFGFTSIDQTTSALTDALSREKAKDCAARSKANFNIALAWIYGTGSNEHDKKILENAPHVATNHPGAWVKAVEIAHRIRNMEYITNTPPRSNVGLGEIESFSGQNFAGFERVVKAFSSAYRNLGNDLPFGNELKNSFRLTELSPQIKNDEDPASLSNLFIPPGAQNFEKHYLDLKLMPINFVNFFTALIPIPKNQSGTDTAREAGCEVSKIAIPIPGYPLGFTKNPQVITYYAVKGEAEFRGLFNPLGRSITLTAYAAAKPFGGRIGPTLFNNYNTAAPSSVFARTGSRLRSLPYAMGLKLDGSLIPTAQDPKKPAIVPADNDLWVGSPTDVIGGSANNTQSLKYVIPNLVYNTTTAASQAVHNSPFFIYNLPASTSNPVPYKLGLYDKEEFLALSKHLGTTSGLIEAAAVEQALQNVKQPTDYENLNYLIPTLESINRDKMEIELDTLGLGKAGSTDSRAPLYAPLYGDNLLYQTSSQILNSIKLFLNSQRPTIDVFKANLLKISNQIRQSKPTTQNTTIEIYKSAADFFHNEGTADCTSMAGQFLYYFYGSDGVANLTTCSKLVSLETALDEIYGNSAAGGEINANTYFFELFYEGTNYRQHFSAYAPGKLTGADETNSPDLLGRITNPFLSSTTQSLRNFYSTKLVSIQSLLPSTEQSYGQNFPLMSEGSLQDITGQSTFENPLNLQEATSDIFQ